MDTTTTTETTTPCASPLARSFDLTISNGTDDDATTTVLHVVESNDEIVRHDTSAGRPMPEQCGIDAVAFDCDGTLIAGSTCSSVFDTRVDRYRISPLLATLVRWCFAHKVPVGIVSYGITERIEAILATAFSADEVARIRVITPSVVRARFPHVHWTDGSLPPSPDITRVTQVQLFRDAIRCDCPLERIALFDDNYTNALSAARAGYTAFWLNSCSLATLLDAHASEHRVSVESMSAMSAPDFTAFWKSAFVTSGLHERLFIPLPPLRAAE